MISSAIAVVALASSWALSTARVNTARTAERVAHDQAALLNSELQKFRLLPVALQEYPDLGAVLMNPEGSALRRLDDKLRVLSARTGAAVIYLIDRHGKTLAASNFSLETSFVGQDYQFRPYFQDALAKGSAELFARGAISGRPGLFLARRVLAPDGALGVIVVKIEFGAIEEAWNRSGGSTIVPSSDRTVLITSDPTRRFIRVEESKLTAREVWRHPLGPGDNPHAKDLDLSGPMRDALLVGTAPTAMGGGRLYHLVPLGPELRAAQGRAALVALAAVLAIIIAAAVVVRSTERRNMLERAAHHLEQEVASRTEELRATNKALIEEGARRKRADLAYRDAREKLAHASRLATLGQVTAGVAHELNQPIAAMRIFAENASGFLTREQPERVEHNLRAMVDLADRMASITGSLRESARRQHPPTSAVSLDAALEGLILLMSDRLADVRFEIARSAEAEPLWVRAEKVRLEQIIINLLQNALDALEGRVDGEILLSIRSTAEHIALTISDNGPGIDPTVHPEMFEAFTTSKPSGLGLGLSIARSIARDFGGTLELVRSCTGGAAFTLTLERCR